MAQLLNADSIDFSAYVKETEGRQKVRRSGAYVDEMIADLGKPVRQADRSLMPWDKTHDLFEFRRGEVTLWAGVNGQGKSMVTGMAMLSLCTQGKRVCIASFEMKPRRTLARMMRQWSAQTEPQAHELSDPDVMAATRDLYQQFRDWSNDWLWLYDQQGTVSTDTLIGVLRYCAKELKIDHFVIDSLMKCIADEDDYNAQKRFVDEVTAIARDYGMHIHLVHHVKKLGKEEDVPDKMDVKGSGSITDQVDNVALVWRNKRKEREIQAGKKVAENEPDALLIVDKQRNGEWEGRIALWYDKDSQQYRGAPGMGPLNFFNFPHRDTM